MNKEINSNPRHHASTCKIVSDFPLWKQMSHPWYLVCCFVGGHAQTSLVLNLKKQTELEQLICLKTIYIFLKRFMKQLVKNLFFPPPHHHLEAEIKWSTALCGRIKINHRVADATCKRLEIFFSCLLFLYMQDGFVLRKVRDREHLC